jgi:hypothetical protein
MKRGFLVYTAFAILFFMPLAAFSADQGVSVGYGIGAFNMQRSFGHVEGGQPYSFIQTTYIYEKPFSTKELALLFEPFGAYVAKPTDGADVGFDLGLKYYPWRSDKGGFYMTGGPGMAYTSIGFQEQGTHLLFILQGGIGYRYNNFFIEDRARHYSNGGTARPNWSVNSNILSIGTMF